jgi:bifunctional DNase/RNase
MKRTRWLWIVSLALASAAQLHAAQNVPSLQTKIKTLTLDPASNAPVVILETIDDKRLLPIWIDVPEARAIALELEQIATPRPLTHDLIRNLLRELGVKLQRVTITDLRNNTYFASLTLELKGQTLDIDSRPSDAIAVALRMKAPIYVSTEVLKTAKLVPRRGDTAEHAQRKLGIQVQDLTPDLAALMDIQLETGVLVSQVDPDSVALAAGLRRGDILTKANDKNLQSMADLEAVLESAKGPGPIRLEVLRKGKATVIVIELPS